MTTCDKCGFDFGKLQNLASLLNVTPQQIQDCPRCQILADVLADDVLCDSVDSVVVGTRVQCKDTDGLGTIVHIALTPAPFRVKWDGDDVTDWFLPGQLTRYAGESP